MLKLKSTFAVIALSIGVASAAFPNWSVKSIPTSVALVSTYSVVSGVITLDANPTALVDLNGVRHAFRYSSALSKEWYTMAREALANGKKIGIYADAENTLSMISCGDFDATKCILRNTNTPHIQVQNLVMEP